MAHRLRMPDRRRVRAAARRQRLPGAVSDRPHVDRHPGPPDLRGRQRGSQGVDRIIPMTFSTISAKTRRLTLAVPASAYPGDRTIVDLFEAQAARTPGAEAVRGAG